MDGEECSGCFFVDVVEFFLGLYGELREFGVVLGVCYYWGFFVKGFKLGYGYECVYVCLVVDGVGGSWG